MEELDSELVQLCPANCTPVWCKIEKNELGKEAQPICGHKPDKIALNWRLQVRLLHNDGDDAPAEHRLVHEVDTSIALDAISSLHILSIELLYDCVTSHTMLVLLLFEKVSFDISVAITHFYT